MDENNIFLVFKIIIYDKDLFYKKYCFFIIVNFIWFLFIYFENILEQLFLENN